MDLQQVRESICDIGKRLYQKGFVAANDGNISVKVNDQQVLVTPTGQSKGYLTPDMIILVDLAGNLIEGKLKPSSETKMHLRVYQERPDINAVVHAHPPFATAFAIANTPLTQQLMPEAILFLGTVPVAKYGTPSTDEIPDAISEYLQDYSAVLLENHGALSWGRTLQDAYFRMETLEFYAHLTYICRNLAGVKEISPENVDKLMEIKVKLGI